MAGLVPTKAIQVTKTTARIHKTPDRAKQPIRMANPDNRNRWTARKGPEGAATETRPSQPEPSQAGDTPPPSGIGERRVPGRMTPEEAETLLDSLKNEDVNTPFVPRASGRPGRQEDDARRDW
jgi:hypothetical protein